MALQNIGQLVFNGLGLSVFYAWFAVGLTLVFGVMKIINFAHGELYMVGAYTFWLVISVGSDSLPLLPLFFLGLVAGMLVAGGLAMALERAIFRALRGSPLAVFLSSFGVAYTLQVSVGQLFGIQQKTVPSVFPGELKFAGAILSIQAAVAIAAAVITLGSLWFFLQRTKLGRAVRATAQDSESAALQGISLNRMSALVMGIGGALAAVAGVLVGATFYLTPYMGWFVIWKAFLVIIVGGMGSVGGAVVASLLFGFLDSTLTTLGNPQLVMLVDVLIMLIILAFRPQGLLGRET